MGLAQWLSVECAIGNGLAAAQKEEAEFIEKQNEEAAFMRIVLCDDDERILGQLKGWLWEYFRENGLSQPDYVSYADGDSLLAAEDRPDAGRLLRMTKRLRLTYSLLGPIVGFFRGNVEIG